MNLRDYVKYLERSLDVPYPERAELVAEISGHIQELYGQFKNEGLGDDAAIERAIATMALDEEVIGALDEVHAPVVRRALSRLPLPVSVAVEQIATSVLAILTLTIVLWKEKTMLSFFVGGGIWMIPLSLMGLAILLTAGERLFSVFIKKDHSERNLRRGLLSLRFLGYGAMLTGILGTLLGYFEAFSAADTIIQKTGGTFPIWVVSKYAITTTIVGLTVALLALVAVYVLRAAAERIHNMRVS
jgi:biopolymer transport protein ExbB/TolQ